MPTIHDDPFNLVRFERAQASMYDAARAEIQAGRKRTHWMWFVFPQVRGLGSSDNATYYGIGSAEEARAYLAHPVLGARLRACVSALNGLETGSASEIFGELDALKLRSCLTLFDCVAGDEPLFARALDKYFGGQRDSRTLAILSANATP